ncbi:hypothetical protein [Acetobacter syzygii]|uniref:hypothetical protein n=1 Tax=Acetobacter syzygii TaxID=146476 RepID=UPI001570F1A9|nr:hypothetical protein [Acetobacter syzygii]NSL91889.1 hypothetical protein [Acetobacter syzygii]
MKKQSDTKGMFLNEGRIVFSEWAFGGNDVIAGRKALTAHPPWQILFICILPQD